MEETTKSAYAYAQYEALGPGRSLAKLCDVLGKSSGYVRQLETWSSQFQWQARAKAYDTVQIAKEAEERRRKRDEAIEAMNERQALIGTTQQSRALKMIDELIKADKFGSYAAVQLLKLALEVEREARGANVAKVEVTGKDAGPIAISGIAIYLPQKGPEV
jgi:hypothetical protein